MALGRPRADVFFGLPGLPGWTPCRPPGVTLAIYLKLGRQDAPSEHSEAYSGHIWGQAAEMLEIGLLRPILIISAARLPKCLKWAFRGPFWPYLRQGCQNTQK